MTRMTHQLEELRQALDDSMLTHTGRSIGDRASELVAKDVMQLIAQHDTELLGEILKQKRTIGTGELFDECEVVDVSVIEQYQPQPVNTYRQYQSKPKEGK